MKKRISIAVSVVALALLLIAGTVAVTVAYLTSEATVTNTFTVGKVEITLDETKIEDGVATGGRWSDGNEYHLLPGEEYVKDPIVHFAAGSESSWLFVKVVNQIANLEDAANSIDDQILENGWKVLGTPVVTTETDAEGNEIKTVETVYVYGDTAVAKNSGDAAIDYDVFEVIVIDENVSNDLLAAHAGKTVVVSAYAIQASGLDSAAAAWTALGN